MRLLACCLLFFGTTAAARNHVGPWGENPDVVPPFAPKEERRAPKNPDGEALWKAFQTPRKLEQVTGGLLVCHLQIGQPKDPLRRALLDVVTLGTAELANADVTLRLRLRAEPPIVLWGPAKHDASFISVPAINLSRDDRLEVTLVDRGLLSDTPLGHVSTRWDGESPFILSTPKWIARCTLLEPDKVSAHARPWLDSLDRQLDRIAAARVDRTQPDLGRPVRELLQLRSRFRDSLTGEGNFRYAAGYLGWEHPEIQSRLDRLRRGEAAFDEAAAREVEAIRQEVAAPGPLLLGASTLRLSRSRRAGTLTLRVEAGADFDCGVFQSTLGTVMLVDERGHFYPVTARLRDAAGHRCEPDATDVKLTPPLNGTLEAADSRRFRLRLLRLADGSFARID